MSGYTENPREPGDNVYYSNMFGNYWYRLLGIGFEGELNSD